MNKTMVVLLLSALVIGTFGAAAVSAAANNAQANNGFFGPMKMWAARNGGYGGQGYGPVSDPGYGPGYGPGYCTGYASYGPYAGTGEAVELEVETVEDALAIAREEIDSGVTENDIYQMGRWWVVYYEDEDEDDVYRQVRIDAFTGEVFDDFTVPAGYQTDRYAQGGANGRFGPGCRGAFGY